MTDFPEIPPKNLEPPSLPRRFDSKSLRDIRTYNITDITRGIKAIVALPGKAQGGDFTDIQAAINYVNGLGGGGTIFIKNGTYKVTDNITLYSNIFLLGEDQFSTFIDFSSATSKQIIISGLSNCGMDNIHVGNSQATKGAIYLTNCNQLRFHKIKLGGNSTYDFYFDNVTSHVSLVEISNCTSVSPQTFLYLKGNDPQAWIFDNEITGSQSYTFYADTTAGGTGYFLNNYVENAAKTVFYGKFTNSKIYGNHIYYPGATQTQFQMNLTNGSGYLVIADNQLSQGGAGGGILMASSSNGYVSITGNLILSSGAGDCLQINSPGSQLEITGNTLIAGTGNGITLDTVAHSVPITGNFISASAGIGIYLHGSSFITIVGNNILGAGSGKDGIKLDNTSASTTIVGNYIQTTGGGTQYAINISDVGSNNIIIANNSLVGTINNAGVSNNIITAVYPEIRFELIEAGHFTGSDTYEYVGTAGDQFIRIPITSTEWPTSRYDFFVEVQCNANSGTALVTRLYNITDGAAVSNTEQTSGTSNDATQRLRTSTAWTPASGTKEYAIQFKRGSATNFPAIIGATIIIRLKTI